MTSFSDLLCDFGKVPSFLWASVNWWFSGHRPYGRRDLPTFRRPLPNINQYIRLMFSQWSVRWYLSHELRNFWERVGQFLLWGKNKNSWCQKVRAKATSFLPQNIYELYLSVHRVGAVAHSAGCLSEGWDPCWRCRDSLVAWGCACCSYSECNCVTLRVIFYNLFLFFYR